MSHRLQISLTSGTRRIVLVDNLVCIFEINCFGFVFAVFDLVHDVEAINSLIGITHISDKISRY